MRRDAYATYILLSAISAFCLTFIFTASAVYQVSVVGLSPLQLVLVGTAVEMVCFVGEIPTGVIADAYSRRLSVIIAYALIGLAFVVEGSIPAFWAVLLAQLFWGLGATFESGALDAWLVDEVGEERATRGFTRSAQLWSVMGIAGVLASAAVASLFGVAAPVWLGGLGLLGLSAVLSFIMPERGFAPRPPEQRQTWRAMAGTVRDGIRIVRARPVLLGLIAAGLVHGAFSEGFDRLWTPVALSVPLPAVAGVEPIVWLAAVRIAAQLAYLPASHFIAQRVKLTQDASVSQALVVCTLFTFAGLVGLAVAPTFLTIALAYIVTSVGRTAVGPMLQTWKNAQIRGEDARSRATVLSMYGQVDAIGQIAGGPVVGAVGNASLRLAMLASALILSPSALLYRRAGRSSAAAP